MLLRVLNSSCNQKVACCCVKIGSRSFYFNTPETFQRFLRETGIKLEHKSLFLITRPELPHVLGLFGAMFTMEDKKLCKGIRIVLPLPLLRFVSNNSYHFGCKFKSFAFLGLGRTAEEQIIQSSIYFGAEDGSTPAFFASPSQSRFFTTELLRKNDVVLLCEEQHEVFLFKLLKDSEGFSLNALFVRDKSDGKFDKEKIARFCLNSDDLREIRSAGHVIKDGVEIKSAQVKNPQLSAATLVLDLSVDEWEAFTRSEFVKEVLSHSSIELKLVTHLCSAESAKELIRRGLLDLFGSATQHIFVHTDFDQCRANHPDESRYGAVNAQLNAAFPFFFPRAASSTQSEAALEGTLVYRGFYEVRVTNKEIILGEQLARQRDLITTMHAVEAVKRIAAAAQPFQALFNTPNPLCDLLNGQSSAFSPFFVILGTGSAVPGILRNVSAILLGLAPDCFGLFDCGEGTLFQLEEQFGPKVDEVLRRLRLVLISHVHGDHTLGLFGLLLRRRKLPGAEPLFVVAPSNVMPELRAYLDAVDDTSLRAVSTVQLQPLCKNRDETGTYTSPLAEAALSGWFNPQSESSLAELQELCRRVNLGGLLPVPVEHCWGSVGYVLDYAGRRIVYSGDCRPTELLAQLGRNADLLLHECTFDCADDPAAVASKGHSSVLDALNIAQRMNARFLCLTHFSQKIRVFKAEGEVFVLPAAADKVEFFAQRAFLALDHLYFDFDRLPQMPAIGRALYAETRFVRAETDPPCQ